MTPPPEPYETSHGVESAIKNAAKSAAARDPSLDPNKRIQLEYFNRFLSRAFSDGADSEWVLKGGAGMLARIPSTRSTKDIDLYRQGFTLEQSLEDLKRLASIDLGDHFHFEYVRHEPSIAVENQPNTDGFHVFFDVYIGVSKKNPLQVDLAVGGVTTDDVVVSAPKSALELPKLISNPYRLYPIVDQIADKVCATVGNYSGRPSSREKDLVDIVVFATTQKIDGTALSIAIDTERQRRKISYFESFVIPPTWGPAYRRLSKPVPHCTNHRTLEQAAELAARMIGSALTGEAQGKTWSPDRLQWL